METNVETLVALITALVLLAGAVFGFLAKLNKNVDEIHVLVNKRLTRALGRVEQLADALRDAGIDVPDDVVD